MRVEFSDKKEFPVEGYFKFDEKRDIAIIKVKLPAGYKALPLAQSPPAKGEGVMAFGCPYGLDFSTTQGGISALRTAADVNQMLVPRSRAIGCRPTPPSLPGTPADHWST